MQFWNFPKEFHVDLYMFIDKLFYEKEKEILQDIIVVQMYEIVKYQMHFQSNYLVYMYV